MDFLAQRLKNWFLVHKRTLPWRNDPTPYQVWISEVMLQQTQVAVVIPFYLHWMDLFPTLTVLAKSPIEKVLKAWEGLGYYSRARNLHEGAKMVVSRFKGKMPDSSSGLDQIKGIGPYTRAAILAFAFKQKVAPVDSNVVRVVSRLFGISESIEQSKTKEEIQKRADSLLTSEQSWIISEALIELGALICGKKPLCHQCPLREECYAYRHHLQNAFPKKKARQPTIFLSKHIGVIRFKNKILVQKGGEKGKVLSDLFEFPKLPGPEKHLSPSQAEALFTKQFPFALKCVRLLPKQHQSYTRYRLRLFPYLFECEKAENDPFQWEDWNDLHALPFSSGHKRILNLL